MCMYRSDTQQKVFVRVEFWIGGEMIIRSLINEMLGESFAGGEGEDEGGEGFGEIGRAHV